jgi:hypothetical protein
MGFIYRGQDFWSRDIFEFQGKEYALVDKVLHVLTSEGEPMYPFNIGFTVKKEFLEDGFFECTSEKVYRSSQIMAVKNSSEKACYIWLRFIDDVGEEMSSDITKLELKRE